LKRKQIYWIVLVAVLGSVLLSVAADTGFAGLGGGGGPMPGVIFLDLSDLNEAIGAAGYPALREVVLLMGGGGYGGAMYGVRLGGLGAGGSSAASIGDQSVVLDLNYGGILMEKSVRMDTDMTLALGGLLGRGSLDLRLVKDLPDTFSDAVGTPYVSSMSRGFFAVQPHVAFEVRPVSWVWARVQLGYLWTLVDPWTFESAEFPGPPGFFGGFVAQMMVRFGLPNWLSKMESTDGGNGTAPSLPVPEPSQEQTPSDLREP
jgi:hypothetical protein